MYRANQSTAGFIIIDPTGFDEEQTAALKEHARRSGGWIHPDGIRWLIPAQQPNDTRNKLVKQGMPEGSIQIAR